MKRPNRAYGPDADDAYEGALEDGRRLADPPAVGSALASLVGRRRWQRRLADARVHELWPRIAGEQLVQHVVPVRLAGGVLVVRASSGAWATQIRYLAAELAERANEALGEEVVTRVTVVTGETEREGGRKHR